MKCYRCNSEVIDNACGCKDGCTIIHGDCLDVLPMLPGESFDMAWTDPPYGHANQDGDLQSARVRDGVKGARKAECKPIANDTDFSVVGEALPLLAKLLKRDCCCCCCCCGGGGPSPTFAKFARALDSDPFAFFHAVVWDKSQRGHGMGWRFRRNYEFVMVAHRRGGKLLWGDHVAVPNIQAVRPEKNVLHPTTKPIELVRRFLQWCEPAIVLDPFMGGGTTLLAAKELGRRAIGIEIEEKYCEIAANRLRQEVLF